METEREQDDLTPLELCVMLEKHFQRNPDMVWRARTGGHIKGEDVARMLREWHEAKTPRLRLAALEEERDRLVEAVEDAFREGVHYGLDRGLDEADKYGRTTTPDEDDAWAESEARDALEAVEGDGERVSFDSPEELERWLRDADGPEKDGQVDVRTSDPEALYHLMSEDAAPQGSDSQNRVEQAERLHMLAGAMNGAVLGEPHPDDPSAYTLHITQSDAEAVRWAARRLRRGGGESAVHDVLDRVAAHDATGRNRIARALGVSLEQDVEAVWHEIERELDQRLRDAPSEEQDQNHG